MKGITDILSCVVTGVEHSGTTITLNLLKKHPMLDSGWECGLLNFDHPNELKSKNRYGKWIKTIKSTWKVDNMHITDMRNSNNFLEAYEKLKKYSGVIKNKKVKLIDKTPLYVYKLEERVLSKIPDVPVVILKKHPLLLCASYKKRNVQLDRIIKIYNKVYCDYIPKLQNEYGDRIMVVRFEDMIMNPIQCLQNIFKFINVPFDSSVYTEELMNQMINPNSIDITNIDKQEIEFIKKAVRCYEDLDDSCF